MSKVVIIGVGALGSHVVQFLRNSGAQIRVVDFDRVEQRNTMSQFHAKTSAGKLKVEGLRGLMSMLWGLKIETVPYKLTDENVEQLLGGVDLVIDCLDNGGSRRVIQQYVRQILSRTACLHGALAADGQFAQIVWDPSFKIDDEASQGAATCEDGEFLPFIAATAGLIAQAAQEFLKTGKQVGYQLHPGGAIKI